MTHLTKKERLELYEYIESIAEQLGILETEIYIGEDPSSEGALASVRVHYQKNHAIIWFSEGWKELDRSTRREVVLHELIHIKLANLDRACDCLEEVLKPKTYEMFRSTLLKAEELTTDSLARNLAKFFPLPCKYPVKDKKATAKKKTTAKKAKKKGNKKKN